MSVSMTSTNARPIPVAMVVRVGIEFRATNVNVAVIFRVYFTYNFLVLIVKHATARVIPTRVRMVACASQTLIERAAHVNRRGSKVNIVMKSTKTSVCRILAVTVNALIR